jgi:ABC-type multidrug transport system fused ATPase/permease subunit
MSLDVLYVIGCTVCHWMYCTVLLLCWFACLHRLFVCFVCCLVFFVAYGNVFPCISVLLLGTMCKRMMSVCSINLIRLFMLISGLWGMIRMYMEWLVVGIIGAALFGAIFPVWGYVLAKTQNMFYLQDTDEIRRQTSEIALVFVFLGFVSLVSATVMFWGIAQVGERVSSTLRSDMFEAIIRREIGFFDSEENSIGTLTTRLSEDSRLVHKASGEALVKSLQAAFTLIVGVIIGFYASWKIALVVLATFPLNIIASAIQMQVRTY